VGLQRVQAGIETGASCLAPSTQEVFPCRFIERDLAAIVDARGARLWAVRKHRAQVSQPHVPMLCQEPFDAVPPMPAARQALDLQRLAWKLGEGGHPARVERTVNIGKRSSERQKTNPRSSSKANGENDQTLMIVGLDETETGTPSPAECRSY
jgi:hypothetical protein